MKSESPDAAAVVARYDAVPYLAGPVPAAHPDHLGTLEHLLGLATAPATRCRVLEIGCADGGHLLPLAEHFPDSEFMGVDPADGSFDLIWSEGSAYNIGFDRALTLWRSQLRPGGYLVLSELAWFRSDPPPHLKTFWDEQYPAIRSVEDNLAAARGSNWNTVANFHLPAEAWDIDYYGPLRERIPDFRREHAGDPDAQAVANMTEQEIEIVTAHHDHIGYEFIVLRRPEWLVTPRCDG